MSLTAPVLFLLFNRPDTTLRVFDSIRKVKPAKLYVAADGPRENKPGEDEKCQETRSIIKQIDWECDVHTLFREKNSGCKRAISSSIDWFFENVEEGIVLEDDCLPDESFFWFCQELLARYRDDNRIMHIGGTNFQSGQERGDGSYYFSRYSHIWGWAGWRRAWKYYDVEIKSWHKFQEQNQINNVFADRETQKLWMKKLQAAYEGKKNTWDIQWDYAIWSQNGLCILPNVNLVSNIGFGQSAAHPSDENNRFANMKTYSINEIIHPLFVLPDEKADEWTFRTHYRRSFFDKMRSKLNDKRSHSKSSCKG